jgi:UDP-N-acetyl-D-mannosaminuronate dehydrogenase
MILKNILKTKTVSVWGLGYLGYTTMLKLQNSGFNILAYDINANQLKQFLSGKYPIKNQIAAWSRMGYLPKLDYAKIKAVNDPKKLFSSSYLHMIAFPRFHYCGRRNQNLTKQLADIFSKNLKHGRKTPLIIFESAFIPGNIEKYFVEGLRKHNLICSRDYYLGAWFRTDWSIERFIDQKDKMPIGGYCMKSLEAIRKLLGYLGISTVELGSLKEAEIYLNSLNTVQAMAADFIRQLALGYPTVNIKRLSQLLFKNITLENCTLNIGTGGERMTLAADNLIQGSENSRNLTLLKEFQDLSISSVLNYGEYIVRHRYKSVAILGITYQGNQKDFMFAPSVTLADYLVKNSIKVSLNDPSCTKDEMRKLVKKTEVAKFPENVFSTDVLILASAHNEYKYLSQSTLDGISKKTKLIIDNYGIWSHLSFGKRIRYHQVGDGTLNLLK